MDGDPARSTLTGRFQTDRPVSLKGFATFWEFSFYGQKKVADYEYHSLFAEKIHFHT